MTGEVRSSGAGGGPLEIGGALTIAACVLLRCLTGWDPMPFWGDDPVVAPGIVIGITPAVSLMVDAVMLLGAAVVFAGSARVPAWWWMVVSCAGAIAVGWHAVSWSNIKAVGGLEHAVLLEQAVRGSVWVSAVFAGVAAACLGERSRRLVIGAMFGVIAMLVVKGIAQVAVEHPQMVASFRAGRAEFLASKGWSEDSPMARAFVRRMEQREATGWWGLANVYASLCAGGLVGMVSLMLAGRVTSGQRRGAPVSAGSARVGMVVVSVGAVAAGGGLVMAGAKGGFAAAALGMVLVAGSFWLTRPGRELMRARVARVGGVVGVAAPVLVLAGVVVRGMIGERLAELSVLFRWFYLQGAAKIAASHPFAGVGPDGFQAAYMIAKPVQSPENVSSPHSIFVDFIAALGLGGWCWVVLAGAAAWVCGRALFAASATRSAEEDDATDRPLRPEVRLLAGCFASAVLAAAWLEASSASLTMLAVRLVGLVAAIVLGGGVLAIIAGPSTRLLAAAAAAGLAVLSHSQIELTGVTPGASAWLAVVLGIASGWIVREGDRRVRGRRGFAVVGAVAMMAAAVLLAVPAGRWEVAIRSAAREVEGVPEAGALIRDLRSGAGGRGSQGADGIRRRARELSPSLAGESPAAMLAALEQYRAVCVTKAREQLRAAVGVLPLHFPTVQALSRVELQLASPAGGDAGGSGFAAAEDLVVRFTAMRPRLATAWGWLGTIRGAWADVAPDRAGLGDAIEAWSRAAELDPTNPVHRVQIARAASRAGRLEIARESAGEALRLSEQMRLDPLQQLTDAQREEMERLAGG